MANNHKNKRDTTSRQDDEGKKPTGCAICVCMESNMLVCWQLQQKDGSTDGVSPVAAVSTQYTLFTHLRWRIGPGWQPEWLQWLRVLEEAMAASCCGGDLC